MFNEYFFFFNDTATTEIYTLSLHDALPISDDQQGLEQQGEFTNSRTTPKSLGPRGARKYTELRTTPDPPPAHPPVKITTCPGRVIKYSPRKKD